MEICIKMELIPRNDYLRRLRAFRENAVIKVITGVRRCGKTTLMKIFMDELRADGVADEQIVTVNFEDYDAIELTEPKALHAFLKSKLLPGKTVFFFLDEIQNVRDFQRVVDSLYIREGTDIYLTGSNGAMLSSDLATLLTGRYVEINMLPLSFGEFCQASRLPLSPAEHYRRYLELGSFPYALQLSDNQAVRLYLEGIFNTILLKDLAQRMKLSDVSLLVSICRFLFENIGSIVSPKRIADTLTTQGRKCDVKTVDKYLTAITDCFVMYEAVRFDIHGKAELARLEKYYLVDPGLRRVLLGNKATDVSHSLENVVYLELVRRGYEVFVGRIEDTEVDFVARSSEGFLYLQVSATVRNSETLERKLRPLKKIKDHYPKLLLTLDDDPDMDYNGILQTNALAWLLSSNKAPHDAALH